MSANTCGTCAHYSGESCAIRVSTPMQHKPCPPTWACPAWQAVERHGITCVCVTCEDLRLSVLVEEKRKQRILAGVP